VSYTSRTAPVTVDLDRRAPNGEAGEGDSMRGIEVVSGGVAADDLRGGFGRDVLSGGPGADRLKGRYGRDVLIGGSGADRLTGGSGSDGLQGDGEDEADGTPGSDLLVGGPHSDFLDGGPEFDRLRAGGGNDEISDFDGGPDEVLCGPGRRDLRYRPVMREFFDTSCERAQHEFGEDFGSEIVLETHPRWSEAGSPTFRLHCPTATDLGELAGPSYPLAGRVRLRRVSGSRVTLGQGKLARTSERRCRFGSAPLHVRVELTPRGRALATRPQGVRVTVSLSGRNLPRVVWTIRLTIPR
jgi:hypothetical protein